jgi:hypothetical protein
MDKVATPQLIYPGVCVITANNLLPNQRKKKNILPLKKDT